MTVELSSWRLVADFYHCTRHLYALFNSIWTQYTHTLAVSAVIDQLRVVAGSTVKARKLSSSNTLASVFLYLLEPDDPVNASSLLQKEFLLELQLMAELLVQQVSLLVDGKCGWTRLSATRDGKSGTFILSLTAVLVTQDYRTYHFMSRTQRHKCRLDNEYRTHTTVNT